MIEHPALPSVLRDKQINQGILKVDFFVKFHLSTPFLDHIILRCAKFAPCDAQGNYDTIRFGKGESLRHRQAGKFPALGEEKSSPLFYQPEIRQLNTGRDALLRVRVGKKSP